MKTRAAESNILPQDFTPDDLPAATLPLYLGLGPAHTILDCTLQNLVKPQLK